MLTDTKIKNSKPRDSRYRIADTNGLVIEIMPKGTKYWRYRYRFNNKATMATLGEYPYVTLAEARVTRNEYRALLNKGVNPNEQKATESSDKTIAELLFSQMFDEWFNHNKDGWKPNYQNDILKRAGKHLLPYIGDKPITEITAQDMLAIFKIVESAGTIDTLHKVKGCASRVFRHCVGLGIIESDPTRDLPSEIFKRKKVKHLAHISDPKEIGGLLRMIDGYKGSYQVESALKMAPYVFLRPGELAGLEWREVDFEDKLIRISAHRTKMNSTHLVPLSHQVLSILSFLKSIKTGSDFVFPSTNTNNRHITPESLRAGLRRMGLSNEEMTTHGFRHMASTRLYELGYKGDIIEKQLAHGERNKIKAAYNHAEYLNDRRVMMDEWANYLDGLKSN